MTVQSSELREKRSSAADVAFDSDENSRTVDGPDGATQHRPNRAIVSLLVLSTAAVLMGLVTFVVGQWVGDGSAETHVIDTTDCRVIAVSVSAGMLESSNCNESNDSSGDGAIDSAHAQYTSPVPSALRSTQVFVPAPGVRMLSMLRSLG